MNGEEQTGLELAGDGAPVTGKATRGCPVIPLRPSLLDGDLEAARRRLKGLAGAACRVLDARTLNVASFHIHVYMTVAMNQARLLNSAMGKADAEQLRKWWRGFEKTEWETRGLREEGAVDLVFLKEVPRPDRTVRQSLGRDGKRQ